MLKTNVVIFVQSYPDKYTTQSHLVEQSRSRTIELYYWKQCWSIWIDVTARSAYAVSAEEF